MKTLLTILGIALALALPAKAATFKAKRGVALDIWVTWPNQDQWSNAKPLEKQSSKN
jgi:endoglucanase